MIDTIIEFLNSNQIASGGIIAVAFGGLLAACKKVPSYLWDKVQYRLFYKITCDSESKMFDMIDDWVLSLLKDVRYWTFPRLEDTVTVGYYNYVKTFNRCILFITKSLKDKEGLKNIIKYDIKILGTKKMLN